MTGDARTLHVGLGVWPTLTEGYDVVGLDADVGAVGALDLAGGVTP